MYRAYFSSPVGMIEVCTSEDRLVALNFVERDELSASSTQPQILKDVLFQLQEYFSGQRYQFDLPIELDGTDFQKNVWKALAEIPFGETVSYGDIAEKIHNPKSSRAVGLANNKNKISIILPCHRVIGKSGDLTGYGGGLWRKEWLLEHEKNSIRMAS